MLYETSTQIWPTYLATINKLEHSKERIKHIIEKEITAVVPNFELKHMNLQQQLTLKWNLSLILEQDLKGRKDSLLI